jgi:hypothetical protein
MVAVDEEEAVVAVVRVVADVHSDGLAGKAVAAASDGGHRGVDGR